MKGVEFKDEDDISTIGLSAPSWRHMLYWRIKRWLREWLGVEREVEELKNRVHRLELREMGFDPDDPHLAFKLQMRAMESNPRAQYRITGIQP